MSSLTVERKMSEEEQGEYEYEYGDDDADAGGEDEEIHVLGDTQRDNEEEEQGSQATSASTRKKRDLLKKAEGYRLKDERCKPVFQSGNLKITAAQAKLYGLLDESGQFKDFTPSEVELDSVAEGLRKLNGMSAPRELDLSHVEDLEKQEETFKPSRDGKALKAMRDPRCGYDFLDQLYGANAPDFLDRINGNEKAQKKREKLMRQTAEEDYKVSHDKLGCPQCKREQSFNEFWEKKRECSLCKVRFQKKNVANAGAFEARLKANEDKRLAKLKAAEDEIYAHKPFKAKEAPPATIAASLAANEESGGSSAAGSSRRKERGPGKSKGKGKEEEEEDNEEEGSRGSTSMPEAPAFLLSAAKKLADMNSEKANMLSAAIKAAEHKRTARERENDFVNEVSSAAPKHASSSSSSSSNSGTSKAVRRGDGAGKAPSASASRAGAEPKQNAGGDKFDQLLKM